MTVMPIYVVIPALDEEASLPLVLADLKTLCCEIKEVVVVDNGSRDQTTAVAREAGATVLFEPKRGYGAACLRALTAVAESVHRSGSDDAVVVFIDADYSDFPEDLLQLVEPILNRRADFVMGSRLALAGARSAVPLPSRVGNWLASRILYALHGVRFTDLGPFRAISFSALERLEMRDRTWGWTVEMQLRACQHGLAIREVPVRYRARHAGSSKISGSLWGGARAAVKILWVLGRHLGASLVHSPARRWQTRRA